jgi:hypothetical protein
VLLHLSGGAPPPETYSGEPRRAWIEYEAVYDKAYLYWGTRLTIVGLERIGLKADRPSRTPL